MKTRRPPRRRNVPPVHRVRDGAEELLRDRCQVYQRAAMEFRSAVALGQFEEADRRQIQLDMAKGFLAMSLRERRGHYDYNHYCYWLDERGELDSMDLKPDRNKDRRSKGVKR